MAQGLPYDSDGGRAWAGALTALMTGHAYAVSARTAAQMDPFAGYHENRKPMLNVLRMHRAEVAKVDEELVPPDLLSDAQEAWDNAVETAELFGVRNSQASVLAPTGCLVGGSLVPGRAWPGDAGLRPRSTYSATITPPPTAPACATSCMSPTSPLPIAWPSPILPRVARRAPSTSAPAPAIRCGR